MDYRELKEKKIFYVAPITGAEDDPSTKKDESVGDTVAYVIADNIASAVAKVKVVDKSLVSGMFTVSLQSDVKDLDESITDKVQKKTIKVNGEDKEVEVKDGDPDYKHKYEAGQIYVATKSDNSVKLFLAKTADDIVAHLADPDVVEVAPYTEKAYLIDHLDADAIAKASETSSDEKNPEDKGDAETEESGDKE